jgi:hypothetical protein
MCQKDTIRVVASRSEQRSIKSRAQTLGEMKAFLLRWILKSDFTSRHLVDIGAEQQSMLDYLMFVAVIFVEETGIAASGVDDRRGGSHEQTSRV